MIEIAYKILSSPITQIFIGAGITWIAAWWYYRKAGNELRDEAMGLRKLSKMILRWQEVDGQNIKLVRDEDGEPQGIARTVELTDAIQSRGNFVGGTMVTPKDPQNVKEAERADRMQFSVSSVEGSMEPVDGTSTEEVAEDMDALQSSIGITSIKLRDGTEEEEKKP